MKTDYISKPVAIIMTTLIMLIAVPFLQNTIVEIATMFTLTKHARKALEQVQEPNEQEKQLIRAEYSSKEFLPDGTIHLVYIPGRGRYKYIRGNRYVETNTQVEEQIYDANGNLLWEGLSKNRPYKYLSWHRLDYQYQFNERRMKEMLMITPELSQTLEIPVVNLRKEVSQVWRYEPAKECFIGYNTSSQKIGYISAAGYTNSKAGTKPLRKFKFFTAWCPQDSLVPILLWQTPRRIYQINFEKRNVELLFESSDTDIERVELPTWPDCKSNEMEDNMSADIHRPTIHCRTKDKKHHLILKNPNQKLTITIPDNWNSRFIKFTATKQSVFIQRRISEGTPPEDYYKSPKLLMQWWNNLRGKQIKETVELYKVADDGNIELLNHYDWTIFRPKSAIWHPREKIREKAMYCVTKFSPPLYNLIWKVWGYKLWRIRRYGTEPMLELLGLIEFMSPQSTVLNWLISAAMMCFVLLHGWPRRTAWPKLIFWLIFVGLLNLAGLLTYLALNHTTVIKCPVCGKRRGLLKTICIRCGSELPVPKQGKLDLIMR